VGDIVSESTGDFISVRLGDFVGIRTWFVPSHNRFLVVNLQKQARRRTTVQRNRSTLPGLARLSIEPQLRDVPSERLNSATASAFSAVSMALRSEFDNLDRTRL
jgi:hypothetical protein